MKTRLSFAAATLALCASFAFAGPENEDIWEIRCGAARGTERFRIANSYADALKKVKGLKADRVRVLEESGEATVYYGRYERRYKDLGAADAFSYSPDPAKDMQLIRSLSLSVPDPRGGEKLVWPFALATLEASPVISTANAEWELTRAPGHWSLQVAVFYNTDRMTQRKFAAEEYCRILRQDGEEAYFYHGAVNSSVFVGAFPKAAIRTESRENPLTGLLEVKSRMVDAKLLALQKKFPHNLHNGAIASERVRGRGGAPDRKEAHSSFAVEIPRPAKRDPNEFGIQP